MLKEIGREIVLEEEEAIDDEERAEEESLAMADREGSDTMNEKTR